MKTNWPALRHGYLILASMALASSPVLAQTQAPAGATAAAAVISSVAITQAPERSAVRVEGEGRLEVHAGRMQNPDRLVLDFEREKRTCAPEFHDATGGRASGAAGKHGGHDVGGIPGGTGTGGSAGAHGQVYGRADFRKLERRGPQGLLPVNSRNQRTQRGAGSCGQGEPHDRSG